MAAQKKRREEAKAKKAKEAKKKKGTTRDTSKDKSRKQIAIDKYGSGGKKGVTRDTSKDKKPQAKGAAATKAKPPSNPGISQKAPVKSVPKKPVAKKPVEKSRAQRILELGGGDVVQGDGTNRRSKSYAGVLPGTPEKKEKKPTRRSTRRGAAARRNRARNTPTTPTLSEKRIKVGNKTVTMVYNGSKWVPKK